MTNLSATHRDASARRRLRLAAGAVSGAMTLVYLWMFFAVRAAEVGASENTFGAYLQLAVVYAVGTALLLAVDRRWVWGVGVVLQVVVIGLFLTFGRAILDYDRVADLPLWPWIVLTTVGQAALVGLLGSLLATTRTPAAED
jgi:hypothetical protein